MGMTVEAQEEKKIYRRQYRSRNRDKINAQQRAWNARNQDKIREIVGLYPPIKKDVIILDAEEMKKLYEK